MVTQHGGMLQKLLEQVSRWKAKKMELAKEVCRLSPLVPGLEGCADVLPPIHQARQHHSDQQWWKAHSELPAAISPGRQDPSGLSLRQFSFAAPAFPFIQLLADDQRVLAHVITECLDPGIQALLRIGACAD